MQQISYRQVLIFSILLTGESDGIRIHVYIYGIIEGGLHMRSMTGFGSGTYSDEKTSITVEIKAVNQRFAEFNIRIPRTYAALEERVRRQ